MVTRKIPQIDQDKTWSCNINNVIYEYPSGTEQEAKLAPVCARICATMAYTRSCAPA